MNVDEALEKVNDDIFFVTPEVTTKQYLTWGNPANLRLSASQ
jgi:hypothetical protein